MVISNPQPSRPSEVKEARLEFGRWIDGLIAKGKVLCWYPRVGRGAVVIFGVSSNDELHHFLTEWAETIPAFFDIYPLASSEGAGNPLGRK